MWIGRSIRRGNPTHKQQLQENVGFKFGKASKRRPGQTFEGLRKQTHKEENRKHQAAE